MTAAEPLTTPEPYQLYPTAQPPSPGRRRMRLVRRILAGLLMLLGLSGLYRVYYGHQGYDGDLKALLVPAPTGATMVDNDDNPDGYLTLDEVIAEYYEGDATVHRQLEARDFRRGVEEEWALGSSHVSVLLFQFDHPNDAARFVQENANLYAANSGYANKSSASGLVRASLFVTRQPDRRGAIESDALAARDTIVVVVLTWESGLTTGAMAADVLARQYALLP